MIYNDFSPEHLHIVDCKPDTEALAFQRDYNEGELTWTMIRLDGSQMRLCKNKETALGE